MLYSLNQINTFLEWYNNESALMFGDDCGFIHILHFKNPISSLFDAVRRKTDPTRSDKTAANSIQHVFWYANVHRFNSKCLYSFVFSFIQELRKRT